MNGLAPKYRSYEFKCGQLRRVRWLNISAFTLIVLWRKRHNFAIYFA
jgi:hypothetical protein